jgi:hypothetical protein
LILFAEGIELVAKSIQGRTVIWVRVHGSSLFRVLLKYHAHVMQARDKRAAVDLFAAARPMRKADDIGAGLPQPDHEGKELRV